MSSHFSIYSWATWFRSLNSTQLAQLRDAWTRAAARAAGHERDILLWDIGQADRELARRRRKP
jgi:hypothetical protein